MSRGFVRLQAVLTKFFIFLFLFVLLLLWKFCCVKCFKKIVNNLCLIISLKSIYLWQPREIKNLQNVLNIRVIEKHPPHKTNKFRTSGWNSVQTCWKPKPTNWSRWKDGKMEGRKRRWAWKSFNHACVTLILLKEMLIDWELIIGTSSFSTFYPYEAFNPLIDRREAPNFLAFIRNIVLSRIDDDGFLEQFQKGMTFLLWKYFRSQ